MKFDSIEYQLKFIENTSIFRVVLYKSDTIFKDSLSKLKKYIEDNRPTKLIILNSYEITEYESRLDFIRELMKSYDTEYYISLATSTKLDNCLHPLVNLIFWRDVITRNTIKWEFLNESSINLFDRNIFKDGFEKKIRGIFSTRKELSKRNYIYEQVSKHGGFDGIYRYVKYPREYTKELSESSIKNYPTTFELINEYKKSYISFVIESDSQEEFMNPLTEKTLISFLTKTMPIVLGGKNYVKELKDMGLYVWNDEFGFDLESDKLPRFETDKLNDFIKCIHYFNGMSDSDIIDMYNSNIEKIENNFNIVTKFLYHNKKTIL